MTPAQLEALVVTAVARLREGLPSEDDRIEFKRAWPGSDKARQLGAAANRSAGDYVVYVIGVDDRDGSIHVARGTDPAKWWSQIESAFDEVAPELVRHLTVRVSETETVVALLFRCDRAPYVVKVQNGGQTEREVPIRAGTRTRSAFRHELLRLLYQASGAPHLLGLSGSLSLARPDRYSSARNQDIIEMQLYLQIYYEPVDLNPIFLPLHALLARLRGPRVSVESRPYYSVPENPRPSTAGILLRHDGIEVRGPGSSYMQAKWKFNGPRLGTLSAIEDWAVDMELGVAGTDETATAALRFGERFVQKDRGVANDELPEYTYGWKLINPS